MGWTFFSSAKIRNSWCCVGTSMKKKVMNLKVKLIPSEFFLGMFCWKNNYDVLFSVVNGVVPPPS